MPSPGARAFGWRDRYHHDETTAPVVAQAYKSILHGTSVTAIVRMWNAAGYRGTRGQPWSDTTVKRVLMNQRNVGRLTHTYEAYDEKGNKGTIIEIVRENAFEPIVDLETFDAVQRELATRHRPQRHPRRRSMFTGLVRCDRCKRSMSRAVVDGKPIYRCWAYRNGQQHGCGLSITARYFEPIVIDALFRYIDSPEFARKLTERSETGTRRADLVKERDRLTAMRDRLRKRMLADDYDEDLSGYEQDVRELGEQLRDVNHQLALYAPVHPAAVWAGNSAGLREVWEDRLDDDEKRAVIEDAFGQITVKPASQPGGRFDPKRIDVGWTDTEGQF
jgi:hypothetical protein